MMNEMQQQQQQQLQLQQSAAASSGTQGDADGAELTAEHLQVEHRKKLAKLLTAALSNSFKFIGGEQRPINFPNKLILLEAVVPELDIALVSHLTTKQLDQLLYIFTRARPDCALKKVSLLGALLKDVAQFLMKGRNSVKTRFGPGLLGLDDEYSNVEEIALQMGWKHSWWLAAIPKGGPARRPLALMDAATEAPLARRPRLAIVDEPVVAPAATTQMPAPAPYLLPITAAPAAGDAPAGFHMEYEADADRCFVVDEQSSTWAYCCQQGEDATFYQGGGAWGIAVTSTNPPIKVYVKFQRFLNKAAWQPLGGSPPAPRITIEQLSPMEAAQPSPQLNRQQQQRQQQLQFQRPQTTQGQRDGQARAREELLPDAPSIRRMHHHIAQHDIPPAETVDMVDADGDDQDDDDDRQTLDDMMSSQVDVEQMQQQPTPQQQQHGGRVTVQNTECHICKSEMFTDEQLAHFPCSHTFHDECLRAYQK